MKILRQENRIYKIGTPIIAITGGIATGKSSFCNFLKKEGQSVIDADELVKEIYSSIEAIEFVKKIAPSCIINDQINFKNLRHWFFKNKSNKRIIENYIYQNLQAQFLKTYEDLEHKDFIFYDIPLLFERDLEVFFDSNVCIYIPREEQIKRLLKRDGISLELAENILSTQLDIEIKKSKAEVIINNLTTTLDLHSQAKSLILDIQNQLRV